MRPLRVPLTVLVMMTLGGVLAVTPASSSGPLLKTAGSSPWSNIGPPGGYVQSVAFDPKTLTTVYLGLQAGGVFKSTNGAATWASAGLQGTQINALVVDPSNDAIVYGAGPLGLWISANFGQTWTHDSKLLNVAVNALTVDPANGSIVYVASQSGGVYKSTNAGASFAKVDTGLTPTQVNDVAVAPSDPATLYAATTSGVFVSKDSGGTWSDVSTGIELDEQSVAVDPSNPLSVWAAPAPSFFQQNVYYSNDGGGDWNGDSSGLPGPPATGEIYGFSTPLVVTATSVYVGVEGSGLYQQAKGAASWQAAGTGMVDPDGLHTKDVYAVAALGLQMLAGSADGGAFRSTNGGATWSAANNDLFGNKILSLSGNPANQNMIYAGTPFGMFVSPDGGKTFADAKGTNGAQIDTIAVDPHTSSTVWAGGVGVFETTTDGAHAQWVNRRFPNTGPDAVSSIAVSPSNSNDVFATVPGYGVYGTTNGGTSWTLMDNGLGSAIVSVIAPDPATPGRWFVGTYGSGVFTSTNNAGSWKQMSTAGLPPSPEITSIADNGKTLVVGTLQGAAEFSSSSGKWAKVTFVSSGKPITLSDVVVKYKPEGLLGENDVLIISSPDQGLFVSFVGGLGYKVSDAPEIAQRVETAFAGDPLLLEGTVGNDIYALPSSVAILSATASSTTATGSAIATLPPGQKPNSAGSISATAATGKGTVTVNDYFADPSTVAAPSGADDFFRVGLSPSNTFHSAAVEDCQLTDSTTVVDWLDGTKWVKASSQAHQASTGCVLITVNATSSPSLKQLAAATFANLG